MDTLALVAGSALFSRNIVQALKDQGYLKNPVVILLAVLVLNVVFSLVDAMMQGYPIDTALVRSIVATVLASLYHDLKTAQPKS